MYLHRFCWLLRFCSNQAWVSEGRWLPAGCDRGDSEIFQWLHHTNDFEFCQEADGSETLTMTIVEKPYLRQVSSFLPIYSHIEYGGEWLGLRHVPLLVIFDHSIPWFGVVRLDRVCQDIPTMNNHSHSPRIVVSLAEASVNVAQLCRECQGLLIDECHMHFFADGCSKCGLAKSTVWIWFWIVGIDEHTDTNNMAPRFQPQSLLWAVLVVGMYANGWRHGNWSISSGQLTTHFFDHM